MRPIYTAHDLIDIYDDAADRVSYCLMIRNQYAHCNWADHENGGLFFADLQASASTPDFWLRWKHIDASLLEVQEAYIVGALEALRFAEYELAFKRGKLKHHVWPKPLELAQPPRHNPEREHVPPWLEPDAQAHYLVRLQAVEQGTPSPKRLAQERRRAEKLAQRQAHRDASKHSIEK